MFDYDRLQDLEYQRDDLMNMGTVLVDEIMTLDDEMNDIVYEMDRLVAEGRSNVRVARLGIDHAHLALQRAHRALELAKNNRELRSVQEEGATLASEGIGEVLSMAMRWMTIVKLSPDGEPNDDNRVPSEQEWAEYYAGPFDDQVDSSVSNECNCIVCSQTRAMAD